VLAPLRAGEGVHVHSAAGLGRTGTVAALLLMALGDSPETVMNRVRAVRPGTVETVEQSALVFEPGNRS